MVRVSRRVDAGHFAIPRSGPRAEGTKEAGSCKGTKLRRGRFRTGFHLLPARLPPAQGAMAFLSLGSPGVSGTRGSASPPRPPREGDSSHCPEALPSQQFQALFTLFSKCFSSFLHSTCSLSVSCQYLAFGGFYRRLWHAVPGIPTRKRRGSARLRAAATGLSPSAAGRSRPLAAAHN